MRVTLDDEVFEIFERLLRALGIDVPKPDQAAQRLNDLHIEKMRSVQPLVGRKRPRAYLRGARGPE